MKTKCKYCGMETPITGREVCGGCTITKDAIKLAKKEIKEWSRFLKDAEKRYTGLIEDEIFEKG
jgi:hypothetical protein